MFEIREDFTSKENRDAHYDKHVKRNGEFGSITPDEYENLADALAHKNVDYKNIFGYFAERKGRECYVKWDKNTEIFVAYTWKGNEPSIITCYIKSKRRFEEDKATDYLDEIPKGK